MPIADNALDGARELMTYLDTRAKWLEKEMRNGGNLEHLGARYAECKYIASMIPLYVPGSPAQRL
jgi:hypothetical protein